MIAACCIVKKLVRQLVGFDLWSRPTKGPDSVDPHIIGLKLLILTSIVSTSILDS